MFPKKKKDVLTQAELDLYRWQYSANGSSGSFNNKLFDLFSVSDNSNLSLLKKAYPEHVEAYTRYISEKGYWKYVQDNY